MAPRKARYEETRWILVVALVASPALHGGAGLIWEATREEPKPRLFIDLQGDGAGTVLSEPEGISCGVDCVQSFERGTEITLRALREQGSTFEGWGGGCTPVEGNALACTLTLEETLHVAPTFGVMPEDVDIVFEEQEEKDEDEDKDEDAVAISLPDPAAEFEKLPVPMPEPEPEVAMATPPPAPEMEPPELQLQPKPEEQPQPPEEKKQPQPQQTQMKAVEVPDENEVEKEPDDATFLSDKNRDVEEQTRATDTNLEKQQKGETPYSEKSDRKSEEIGADEEEIAQFEEVEETSLDAERVTENETRGNTTDGVVPRGEEGEEGEEGEGGDGSKADEPGVMAMRGIDGRGPPGGPVVDIKRDESPSGRVGKEGKRGRRGIKTQLDDKDYRRIVGTEVAEREVELGRKRKSKRLGRWERKQKAVRAALENFIPEVKPGNQTALKTRKAPFALYVARMHRRIHELWGFGFLDELDGKSATDPLNNWNLQTIIEVSINPDGSIHKTTIVGHSGVLMFDVAAIDTLYTAGPFLETPEEIRSVDGRVYLHWVFRRDWQQCGTFNVRMYILDEINDSKIDDGHLVRHRKGKRGKRGGAGGGTAGEDSTAASARAHANMPAPDDPHAQSAANQWLTGFAQRDIKRMIKVSAAPFSSGDKVVANQVSELAAVYRNILSETRGRIREYKLLSPAGYRSKFGNLPPGVDIAAGNLLMAVRAGSDRFTLVLKRTPTGDYKIVAFHR